MDAHPPEGLDGDEATAASAAVMLAAQVPGEAIKRCVTCNRVVAPARGKPGSAGLRRGLCRACYLRAWRGTALPEAAACVSCSERRRVVLRWTKVGASRVITCQNCGFVADRSRPKPRSLDELCERLQRERRVAPDRRRNYVIDPLDPSERRVRARRVRRRSG